MRRQESAQVQGKSAGRNEAGMRSEKQQVYRQRFSDPKSLLRFAPPAVVALGGGGAAHRVHQNDMPPLPGSCRDTCCFYCLYAFSVSGQIPIQITS
jgi:hypothetical protein